MSELRDAMRKIGNMFSRGALENSDDSKKTQVLKGTLLADETATELHHPQEYGFTSRALDGAETYVVFPGGDRDNPIVIIVAHGEKRIKGLAKGEVAVYHHGGSKIVLKNDNTIEATCPTFKVNGDIVATGNVSDANGSMQEMRTTYNGHTHPETGSTTGAPNQQMT